MANLTNKKLNFALRTVESTEALIAAIQALRSLRAQWDAESLGALITDEDLTGELQHIDAADLTACFVSLDALNALLAQGHATNFYALVR